MGSLMDSCIVRTSKAQIWLDWIHGCCFNIGEFISCCKILLPKVCRAGGSSVWSGIWLKPQNWAQGGGEGQKSGGHAVR